MLNLSHQASKLAAAAHRWRQKVKELRKVMTFTLFSSILFIIASQLQRSLAQYELLPVKNSSAVEIVTSFLLLAAIILP